MVVTCSIMVLSILICFILLTRKKKDKDEDGSMYTGGRANSNSYRRHIPNEEEFKDAQFLSGNREKDELVGVDDLSAITD